jgi:hypothetical protein
MSKIDIFCNVLLQVSIIFSFLTIFFFSYVTNVEKNEFEDQINFIVDNIYKRYQDSINSTYNKTSEEQKKYIKMLIYGIIDIEQEQIKKESIIENNEIKIKNDKIYKDAIYCVIIFFIITIIILSLLTYIYKLPIKNYIQEAFIVLLFIFVIEFLFLNLIVKKYITANPNIIKNKIADSIIKYIETKDNKDNKDKYNK